MENLFFFNKVQRPESHYHQAGKTAPSTFENSLGHPSVLMVPLSVPSRNSVSNVQLQAVPDAWVKKVVLYIPILLYSKFYDAL